MAWYDRILPTIAAVAPTIATALGGPLAGMGVNALFSVLGVSTPEEAEQALINMSPADAAKVRAADQQFAKDMRALDIDVERIAAADRDSARKREIEVKDKIPGMLAIVLVTGFFGVLGLMAFVVLPIENKDALMLMVGGLIAAFTGMVSYYYGTSASSRQKDARTAEMVRSVVGAKD